MYKLSVAKPLSGRRFVIPDVHGCALTLKTLVNEKLGLTRQDQLFLLGDYISRGPDSAGVIEFILHLQKEGYEVYPLKGNHEDMLLEADGNEHQKAHPVVRLFKSWSSIRTNAGKILPRYRDFFESLPHYCELEDFYLVHAGFNFQITNPFEDTKAMLWTRSFRADPQRLGGRRIVHGHETTPMEAIRLQIAHRHTVLPLDNGCYLGLRTGITPDMGNLCALNLDSFELLIQPNVDKN